MEKIKRLHINLEEGGGRYYLEVTVVSVIQMPIR